VSANRKGNATENAPDKRSPEKGTKVSDDAVQSLSKMDSNGALQEPPIGFDVYDIGTQTCRYSLGEG
jgi:hypothetical protein